ncbi:MAG: DUF1990 domain-containing protein [Bryobacteraceae bacterium]
MSIIRFREPDTASIRDFLNDRQFQPFSYPETGYTQSGKRPAGYHIDRHRVQLGAGEAAFERARKSLRDWRMFSLDWVRLCWPFKRIQPGVVVGIVTHQYWFWTLNAARIVYVIDEPRRFGFAYGTLLDHVARGEEQFLVDWRDDDSVWYEISSFSVARHWIGWAGYPLARLLQRQFGRDSVRAMARAMVEDRAPIRIAG